MLPAGLRLYRLWHAGAPGDGSAIWPDRPPGRLVWVHAASAMAGRGVPPLVRALLDEGGADSVVLSCPEPLDCEDVPRVAPPPEATEAVDRFLDHWRPDLGIWFDGTLRPVLLHRAAARSLPMLLVDGRAPDLPGARWWPRLMPGLLAPFRRILVQDDTALRLFAKAGAAASVLSVIGPLEEPSHHRPVNEAERAALARAFGTRPVWLAMGVPEAEDDAVAAAHLAALRMAHRLLLILVPDTPARGAALADRMSGQFGLETALRSREEEPLDDTQVYLADTDGEQGLWYRLAPLTFLGGTLAGTGPVRHPFEAAAMGSALVHGLATGSEAQAFERLRRAGASRVVPGAADLGEAVGDLLAPDRCARLAQAAWAAASAGGEATAQVVGLARQLLDEAV